MPAKAGIEVNSRCKFKQRLDSGMRRNDGNRSRLPVDKFKTPRASSRGLFSSRPEWIIESL